MRTASTKAARSAGGAEPASQPAEFPLVVISHGYPGNRFLMSHLAENLASKGYAVVSIDHADSTYNDQNIPEAVAVDRPRDVHFILHALTAAQSASAAGEPVQHPVLARLATDRIGLVGYSMGGYGVLMAQGAQLAAWLPGQGAPTKTAGPIGECYQIQPSSNQQNITNSPLPLA